MLLETTPLHASLNFKMFFMVSLLVLTTESSNNHLTFMNIW